VMMMMMVVEGRRKEVFILFLVFRGFLGEGVFPELRFQGGLVLEQGRIGSFRSLPVPIALLKGRYIYTHLLSRRRCLLLDTFRFYIVSKLYFLRKETHSHD
jgi:hypothetical protein